MTPMASLIVLLPILLAALVILSRLTYPGEKGMFRSFLLTAVSMTGLLLSIPGLLVYLLIILLS